MRWASASGCASCRRTATPLPAQSGRPSGRLFAGNAGRDRGCGGRRCGSRSGSMLDEARMMPYYSIDGLRPAVPGDDDFWVAPNATLIGNVRLAHAVSIWFGAVLRADNDTISIGTGSNVQDNCVLHAD